MTALANDIFTGTNGTLLPAYNAAAWATMGGLNDLAIESNGVQSLSSQGGDAHIGINWPADQYSQALVMNVASDFQGTSVRANLSSRTYYNSGHYMGGLGHIRYIIEKWVSGVQTTLNTHPSQVVTIGDTVYLEIVGSTLTLKVNTVPILTATDSSIVSGNPGLVAFDSVATTPQWDNWEGGTPSAPGPPPGAYTVVSKIVQSTHPS